MQGFPLSFPYLRRVRPFSAPQIGYSRLWTSTPPASLFRLSSDKNSISTPYVRSSATSAIAQRLLCPTTTATQAAEPEDSG